LTLAADSSSGEGAGAVLTGGASGEGASWPHPAAGNAGKLSRKAATPNRTPMLFIVTDFEPR
jgi:hypothetical protein